MKLFNNEAINNNDFSSSTSTHNLNNRLPKPLSHKSMSFQDNNENSIDADVDLAMTFPDSMSNDIDGMKEYTDNIWKKTLCDRLEAWGQPKVSRATPSIVWPTTSTQELQFHSPQTRYYNDDIWSNITGTNVFFPTTAPSTTSGATSTIKRLPVDSNGRKYQEEHQSRQQKFQGRKKITGGIAKYPTLSSSAAEIEIEEYNHIKKRLSLSALRNTLCRQKAVENLNKNGHGLAAGSETDEFLQVLIFLCDGLFYFIIFFSFFLKIIVIFEFNLIRLLFVSGHF